MNCFSADLHKVHMNNDILPDISGTYLPIKFQIYHEICFRLQNNFVICKYVVYQGTVWAYNGNLNIATHRVYEMLRNLIG